MSIMDLKLELSDDQAITAAAISFASTNDIDLGAADISLGAGTPLYLNIRVNEGCVSAHEPATDTVQFILQSDTGHAFATPTAVYQTPAILCTTLVAGHWVIRMPIPYEFTERQMRLKYLTSCTTGFSTGSFDSWISLATPDTDVGA